MVRGPGPVWPAQRAARLRGAAFRAGYLLLFTGFRTGGNLAERASGVRWQVVGQADDAVAAGGYLGVVGGQDDRAAVGRDSEHAG